MSQSHINVFYELEINDDEPTTPGGGHQHPETLRPANPVNTGPEPEPKPEP